MPRLAHIQYQPHLVDIAADGVNLRPQMGARGGARSPLLHSDAPFIFWRSGQPWHEANLYLAHRASLIESGDLDISTLRSDGWALYKFATFLEEEKLDWNRFGAKKSDRPTNVYRGWLIMQRNEGRLAASTASARMATVLRFYRWVLREGVLNPESPPFEATTQRISYADTHGFERSFRVNSTDLRIPNKKKRGTATLEDGLRPVSLKLRDQIMALASKHCSIEFQMMLALGFLTGMRLQSILDLKVETLTKAIPGETDRAHYIGIGPQQNPPVATKFGVNGSVFIPTALLEHLKSYANSARRLKRVANAQGEDGGLLFLNRFGARYANRGKDKAPSINVDMTRLRQHAARDGIDISQFYFHCSRATFATHLVVSGLRLPTISLSAILCRVKELLLHKDETTSMGYIKYVQGLDVQADFEESYANWMFGSTEHE